MEALIEVIEHILGNIILIAKVFLEVVGVLIIIWGGIQGVISYVRNDGKTRKILGESMATALSFMMGSEILRTVTAPDLMEIAIIGGIIVLRVALTVLLHWEMSHEKEE